MNYLFFDIECATCRGGAGKICSIGYVIVDKYFKVLKKGDLLINPNIPAEQYDKYVLKNVLTYKISDFESKPNFLKRLSKIKALLCSGENVLFGFDISSDLKFLYDECNRYNVAQFDLSVFDVQLCYRKYSGEDSKTSLSRLTQIFDIDCSMLKEHNSRDDSIMTMQVLKCICDNLKLSLDEACQEFADCFGKFKPTKRILKSTNRN